MTTGLLITTAGQAAITADLSGGTDLVLTHVAFGDSSGVPYPPNVAQTALVNERYRSSIASVAVVDGAIVIDAIIPADTPDGSSRPSHGFNIAEAGIYSNSGTLIGVARMGNGYKPPPSSGQAAIATFRFKLAVANPSAITVVIDPVAQISVGRHVRPFWLTVDGVLNDPPIAPAVGATYVIGAAPTGAWTGFAHRLAQWVGVWALASVPTGHQVIDQSKWRYAGNRWLERTATGWDAGLTRLVQRQPGNYANVGGTANALTITLDPAPISWDDLIGVPLRLLASSTSTASATLAVTGLAGTKPFTRAGGLPSKANDIMAGQILEGVYDGTQVQILSIIPSVLPSRVLPSSYTAPGNYTYVVPAGVYWVRCRVWGAGGGGGWANTNAAASGGNGGGYAEGIYPVTPGQSLPVVVGTFGAGGTPEANNGSPGGTSSVGSLLSATGGGGGQWYGTTNSTTGNGSGGQINISGGLAANGSFFGSTPVASAGGGAFSASGSGVSVSGGVKANYPGGGGGGGANNNNGAPGENGLVVIEPY